MSYEVDFSLNVRIGSHRCFFSAVWIVFLLCILERNASAQGVPEVTNRMVFAGVTIHLSNANRDRMQREVEAFYLNRPLVNVKVEQMGMYFPLLEPLLEQESIPDDFKYLALEDSTLLPSDHPAGFWALTRFQPLGLKVTGPVDERLHLLLATQTAITWMKQARQPKDNWITTLRQYFRAADPEAVRTELPTIRDGIIYLLVDENTEPVLRLLAHKLVLERAFSISKPQHPLILFPYVANRGQSTDELVNFFRVNKENFVRCNPWLKSPRLPNEREYTVFIPALLEQYNEVKRRAGVVESSSTSWQDVGFPVLQRLSINTDGKEPIRYLINGKKGIQAQLYDNDITLAYKGKVSRKAFWTYNDFQEGQPIYPGEVFYLEKKDKKAKVPFHIVRRGQSLWDVAQQYGIQLESLIQLNEIGPKERLTAGRVLYLQKKRLKEAPIEYLGTPGSEELATTEALAVPPAEEFMAPMPAPEIAPPLMQIQTDSTIVATWSDASREIPSNHATKMIRPSASVENPDIAPISEQSASATGRFMYHIVQPGETLYLLAVRFKVTMNQLMRWNKLAPYQSLEIGRKLLVKKSLPTIKSGR